MSDDSDSSENLLAAADPLHVDQPGYWRFKGSGNPAGRPKGSKNRKTIVREVMQETHFVKEDGRKTRRSTLELVLFQLRNMALGGKNQRAGVEFQKLIEEYEPQMGDEKSGVILVPGMATSNEEFKSEAERLITTMPRHRFRR